MAKAEVAVLEAEVSTLQQSLAEAQDSTKVATAHADLQYEHMLLTLQGISAYTRKGACIRFEPVCK